MISDEETVFVDDRGRSWSVGDLKALVSAVRRFRQSENVFQFYFDDDFDY